MSNKASKRRYNLRDVAHEASVSVATVSRVLNSPSKVSPDTREKVEETIARLRFVPSAAARAMNLGRSRMVAALLPTLDNATYARVVNGLENRLAASGLSLIIAQTRDEEEIKLARAKELIEIGAEGFIVAGVSHSPEFHALIAHAALPTVSVSYFDAANAMPTVGYDNADAVRIAADHLWGLGHRTAAVIHGPLHNNDRARLRYEALQALMPARSYRFFETTVSLGGGADAIDRLLASKDEATGIICFSDTLAMGVLNRLHSQGFAVPDHFSVVGIENLPGANHTFPPLTSVRLQIERMGELAADALAGWLERDEVPVHIQLPVELITRASTAPPRQVIE